MSEKDKNWLPKEWQELTKMTRNNPIVVERVRLTNNDIAIEGSFELPPLAQLTMEDQIFAAAFIKSHGSIKEMEHLFGVSYPTIKSRLNRIADRLDFVDVQRVGPIEEPDIKTKKDIGEILEQLEQGQVSVQESLKILKELKEQ